MICESCKNWKLWERAAKACECCVNAGSHHGRSHVKADDFTLAQPKAIDFNREPSGQATNLSAEDEGRLRMAMSSLFGLEPVDLILIQHLFNGGTLESFGHTLAKLRDKIRFYAQNSDGELFDSKIRAMAHARKNRIIEVFPQIEPVFKHLIGKGAKIDGNPDKLRI